MSTKPLRVRPFCMVVWERINGSELDASIDPITTNHPNYAELMQDTKLWTCSEPRQVVSIGEDPLRPDKDSRWGWQPST